MKFKLFKSKKVTVQTIIIIILSSILFYYSLKTFYLLFLKINKKTKFSKKFIEKKQVEQFYNKNDVWGRFYFYSKNNCSQCKQIKEEWNELLSNKDIKECSQTINGCRFNNKIIEFLIIECDDDENSCYNIKSYPSFTLEIIKNNKQIDYKNSFSVNSITQWLKDQTK